MERSQNLPKITQINATRTCNVWEVLRALQDCEKITLTEAQMNLGADILQSVRQHGSSSLSTWYLIRYGMSIASKE